jgi:hypothetical protein
MRTVTVMAVLLSWSAASGAQDDVVTIEGTRIEGDEELPALVFDMPWQPSQFPLLDSREERLMTRRPVTSLERPVVQRQNELHHRLMDILDNQESSTP